MFRSKAMFCVTVILCMGAVIYGCSIFEDDAQPVPEPVEQPDEIVVETEDLYNFSGKVVDHTGDPVANAKIISIVGTTSEITFTDANGEYRFEDISTGKYTLTALVSGYTFGEIKFNVTENGASVPDLILNKIDEIVGREEAETTGDEIKTNGIQFVSTANEEVSTGGTGTETVEKLVKVAISAGTEITIDDEVITEDIVMAASPLQVDEIPPPEEDEMPMGAIMLEPQGATFSEPVEISVPLEIQLPAGIEIPLKKYEDGEWKTVGTATIDESGLGADSEVTEFGQFSIQPKVTLDVELDLEPEETQGEEVSVAAEEDTYEGQVTDTLEFPGGLPEGVTYEYAVSLIENIKGTKFGVPKNVVVESPLTQATGVLAKRANVDEYSKKTWTVQEVTTVTDETYTISIDVGGAQKAAAIDITITVQVTITELVPKVTGKTTWQDITLVINGVSGVKITNVGSKFNLPFYDIDLITGDFFKTKNLNESLDIVILRNEDFNIEFSKTGYTFLPSFVNIADIKKDYRIKIQGAKIPINVTISCIVLDQTNTAVAGANCKIVDSATNNEIDDGTTDGSGLYSFSVAGNQACKIYAEKDGYTTSAEIIGQGSTLSQREQVLTIQRTSAKMTVKVNGGGDGVQVELKEDDEVKETKTVSGNGRTVEFTGDIGGKYEIRVYRADDKFIVTSPKVHPVIIPVFQGDETVAVTLAPKTKTATIRLVNKTDVGTIAVTVTNTGTNVTKVYNVSNTNDKTIEVKSGFTIEVSSDQTGLIQNFYTFENIKSTEFAVFESVKTFNVSGSIQDLGGNPFTESVTIEAWDVNNVVAHSVVTTTGTYTLPLPAGVKFTLVTVYGGTADVEITPSSYPVKLKNNNVTKDFTATTYVNIVVTVTGGNALVSCTGQTPITVNAGTPGTFRVPAGYDYVVTPTSPGVTFTPTFVRFENITANQSAAISVQHNQGSITQ
ncbi:carboxypeptidase-like regulatory domain-containing protein [Candidatus Omnitrophota bacterium]